MLRNITLLILLLCEYGLGFEKTAKFFGTLSWRNYRIFQNQASKSVFTAAQTGKNRVVWQEFSKLKKELVMTLFSTQG